MKFPILKSQEHYFLWLMLMTGIILVMFYFGFKGAKQDTIRRDELTTLGHIGALEGNSEGVSFSYTIQSLATYSAQHPPLYFLSANLWGRIFSFDSYIIRLLSLFWGLLTVAVFYQLSRLMGGRLVAVYSTLLLSTSIIFLFYTHEIRQYASLIFWVVLVWLLYWRFSHQRQALRPLQLILLCLVTTCAIYTHYSSIFLLIAIGCYHLFFVPKTKAWWQISGAIGLAGLLFLFWLPTMLVGLDVTTGKLEDGNSKLLDNPNLIAVVSQFWGNGHAILSAILVGLGIVSAWLNKRGSRYVLFFFSISVLAVLLVNGNFEFIKRIRYVLVTIVPFYLLGGYALALLHRWRILPVIILVIWFAIGTNFQLDKEFEYQTGLEGIVTFIEYNELVPILKEGMESDEILITVIDDFSSIDASKHGKMGIEEYYLHPLNIVYTHIHSHYAQDFILQETLDVIADHPSFWLTFRGSKRQPELIEFDTAIEADYRLCEAIDYGQKSHLEHYIVVDQFETLCTK